MPKRKPEAPASKKKQTRFFYDVFLDVAKPGLKCVCQFKGDTLADDRNAAVAYAKSLCCIPGEWKIQVDEQNKPTSATITLFVTK